jgi:hypothetical protein
VCCGALLKAFYLNHAPLPVMQLHTGFLWRFKGGGICTRFDFIAGAD